MSPPSSPPICRGCDRPTVARPARGVIRWACDTPDCPIVDVGPALPRTPRKPVRRIPEPPGGPSLLWDDEPFHR
jgi:hypothetical protein